MNGEKHNRLLLIFFIGNVFLLFVAAPVPIGFSYIEGEILGKLFTYQLFSEDLTYDHLTTVFLLLSILLSVGIRVLLLLKPTNHLKFLNRCVISFLLVDMLVCLISQIYYIFQESKDNDELDILNCTVFFAIVCVVLFLLWILRKVKEKQKIAVLVGMLVIYFCGSVIAFTGNLLPYVVTRVNYIPFCFVADAVVLFCLLCNNKTNIEWKKKNAN